MTEYLTVLLNEKVHDGVLAEYSVSEGARHYLALRNIGDAEIKKIEQKIQGHLGQLVRSENKFGTAVRPSRIFASKSYLCNGFQISFEMLELDNEGKYDDGFSIMDFDDELRAWGAAERGKMHVLFRLVEYARPEIVSEILKDFRAWFGSC